MARFEVLDKDAIRDGLLGKQIGREVVVYRSTSSTNDIAAAYATNIEHDGYVILSEEQTKGRGRAGAEWFSQAGESVLCSMVLTRYQSSSELLSLVAAVCVAETVGERAKIKWPNDILVDGKKIAGILLEVVQQKDFKSHIIGIGINCHQQTESLPAEIREIATSMDEAFGLVCDRNLIVKRLLGNLEHFLKIAEQKPEQIVEEWNKRSLQLGHRLRVMHNGKEYAGHCRGVDPEKGLILQLDGGSVRMFEASQTSIVKNSKY